jgi:hypothetical protein
MIFTECTKCSEVIIYPYEAGDEPIGAFAEVICEKCGAKNYIERISFGGQTYSEEDFKKLNPKKII